MSDKRKISAMISRDLHARLWRHIQKKGEEKKSIHGLLSKAVEEALDKYLEGDEDGEDGET